MLGQSIRRLRLERGLSQRQLAGRELSRNYISMIESGRAQPAEKTLRLIAHRLGTTADALADRLPAPADARVALAVLGAARRLQELEEFEQAVRLAETLPRITRDQTVLCEGDCLLISCLGRLGEHEQALSACTRVLPWLEAQDDRERLVWVYLRMGANDFALQRYDQARRAYESAASRSSHLKQMADLHVEALTYLGSALTRLGELAEAASVYQQAFRLSEAGGEPAVKGRLAMGLGKALYQLGQVEQSLSWTEQACRLLEEAGSDERVLARHNLAVLYAARGETEEAHQEFMQCLRVYEEKEWTQKQASVLEDIALLQLHGGQPEEAMRCCRKALCLLDEKDDGLLRGRLYRIQGSIAAQLGNAERAHDAFRISYDLLKRLGASHEAELSLAALNQVSLGHKDSAPRGPAGRP